MSEQYRPHVLWASSVLRFGASHWARTVTRGEAAIEAVRQAEYDLVICDMKGLHDGMNGGRVCKAMRAIKPNIKVILMSPTATPAELAWASSNGALKLIQPTAQAIQAELTPLGIHLDPAARAAAEPQAVPRSTTARTPSGKPDFQKIVQPLSMFLGPVAAMEVQDAIKELRDEGNTNPTMNDVIQLVADSITDQDARIQFLRNLSAHTKK